MRTAWAAYLLTGASIHGSNAAWLLSGAAESDAVGARPKTLTAAQELDRVVYPSYLHRPRYVEVALERSYRATGGPPPDGSWFPLWVEADERLNRRTPRPLIIGYALLAHASAWTQALLEFSIPLFVRAAEGVIAIPKAAKKRNKMSMQDTFCERARRLVPTLAQDEYVRANLDALLPKLYQLRSDCVHGKVPFEDLKARGEEGQDEAAQLNYVAEVLAREALLLALRRQDWSVFESRASLEAAWASGAFP
jgi:hypothetical protein